MCLINLEDLRKFSHNPENAKQLPTGYSIIITIGVGNHLNH